ncbi:MAG: hypothetical protein CSB01_01575 [Bacteroidia bacterium]|nr:MAG: hypothetical protein CSB01_01575 [Bacteroidia bacterium]
MKLNIFWRAKLNNILGNPKKRIHSCVYECKIIFPKKLLYTAFFANFFRVRFFALDPVRVSNPDRVEGENLPLTYFNRKCQHNHKKYHV